MAARIAIYMLALGLVLGIAPCWAEAAPVAYYSFDADNADDLSGNNNDGTLGAGIAFGSSTPSGMGRAVVSNGAGNSLITVATSSTLQSIDDGQEISTMQTVQDPTELVANTKCIKQHECIKSDLSKLTRAEMVANGKVLFCLAEDAPPVVIACPLAES